MDIRVLLVKGSTYNYVFLLNIVNESNFGELCVTLCELLSKYVVVSLQYSLRFAFCCLGLANERFPVCIAK